MGVDKFFPRPVWSRPDDDSQSDNIPTVDSDTGIYTDEKGRKWAQLDVLAKLLGLSKDTLQRRVGSVDHIFTRKPEKYAKKALSLPLDAFAEEINRREQTPHADGTSGIYEDETGIKWAPLKVVAKILHTHESNLREQAKGKKSIDIVTRNSQIRPAYQISDFQVRMLPESPLPRVDSETSIYIDQNGNSWASVLRIAELARCSPDKIKERITGQKSLKGILKSGRESFLYSLQPFEKEIREAERVRALPHVNPETGLYADELGREWGSIAGIARILEVNPQTIERRIIGKQKIDEAVVEGNVTSLFPIDSFKDELSKREATPRVDSETGVYVDGFGKSWAPIGTIANIFRVQPSTIERRLNKQNSVSIDVIDRAENTLPAYQFDFLIAEFAKRREFPVVDPLTGVFVDKDSIRWASRRKIEGLKGVASIADRHFQDKKFIYGMVGSGVPTRLYRVDDINLTSRREKKIELINRFKEFLNDASVQQMLKGIIKVFGSKFAHDIVHSLRPEFKDVPGDTFKGYLSEFLGDYLPTPGPLVLGELEVAVKYLRNDDQKQILSTIVRHDCLHDILAMKRKGAIDDVETARLHIAKKRTECASFMTSEFEAILNETEHFFCSNIYGYRKSPGLVDQLSPDRPFPDIYQRVNCGEIEEKKRLLIADEMGVGKSASAIFAKESLGVRCALVVVPANVQETWLEYLDEADEARNPKGYFKKGEAPRVLVLDDPTDVKRLSEGEYDYIVISQEKLNRADYTSALMEVDYQMLIIDEVHKVKKEKGKRAEAVLDLSRKINGEKKYLALLSGTPIPNKISDVAMLLRLLHPEKFEEMSRRELVSSVVSGTVGVRSLLAPHMQMKSLAEHIEMPNLIEETVPVELTDFEAEIYKSLLEDDEYTANEKISILLKFLQNPRLLDITPPIVPSKIQVARDRLAQKLQFRRKPVMFVNEFISDVIRGEESIIPDLHIPADIKTDVIHGQNRDQRAKIIEEFGTSPDKHFLAVSGQTMDVGIDLSAADYIMSYNYPWTLAQRRQQIARAFRPGLKGDLMVDSLETVGTIEEGIRRYLWVKHHAIEKILRGGIITQDEQDILLGSEKFDDDNLELNAELAKFYFSAMDKINRVYFRRFKHLGEEGVRKILDQPAHREAYAEAYKELVGVSYQANANRISAALIDAMARTQGKANPRIFDLASGPEMLRRHSPERIQNIRSADINPAHFEGKETSGDFVVTSYRETGEPSETFDYVNMSLAFHHERLAPSIGIYDSAEVLMEMARVLKVGGRAIINEIYSITFKDMRGLEELASHLGLKLVSEYSGDARQGTGYCSRVITFEKVSRTPDKTVDFFKKLPRRVFEGLKMKNDKTRLRGQRKIVTQFSLGTRIFDVPLNARDRMLVEEEEEILDKAVELKQQYGAYEAIPVEKLLEHGFGRMRPEKKYILFKLSSGGGMIIAK